MPFKDRVTKRVTRQLERGAPNLPTEAANKLVAKRVDKRVAQRAAVAEKIKSRQPNPASAKAVKNPRSVKAYK